MTRRKRALLESELRAIRRTIAEIETSFEGVYKFVQRAQRMTTSKPLRSAARKLRSVAK